MVRPTVVRVKEEETFSISNVFNNRSDLQSLMEETIINGVH